MNSGIYIIKFYTGHFYIGKSDNIEQRWKTHRRNFEQGTHTKLMQNIYNQCGEPQYEILLPVHPDHVHIYESIYIHNNWGPLILNAAKPKPLSPQDSSRYIELYDEVNFNGASAMLFSTLQHLESLKSTYSELQQSNDHLQQLQDSGIVLPLETELKIHTLEELNQQYLTELRRLKRLGWWDRLWNYKVYV